MKSINKNTSALKGYTISYAQNREDLIIKSFFTNLKKGFYIDVGANDPEDDSVTKIFYESGWSGINIEPNIRLFNKIKKQRKRDINLNIGIANNTGKMFLRLYDNHGLSTFSEEMKNIYLKQKNSRTINFIDKEVQVTRLEEIFKKYTVGIVVNFIKIDVEGFEESVIDSNDWNLFRPELICIEENHILKKDWRNKIINSGYTNVFNDGLNGYYLRNESLYRLEEFDYVKNLIIDGVVINPGIARKLTKLDTKSKALYKAKTMLKEKEKELISYNEAKFLLTKLCQIFVKKYLNLFKKN